MSGTIIKVYDIIDGCVNDVYCRINLDIPWDMLKDMPDNDICDMVSKKININLCVDNSGDYGDRIELMDSNGDPVCCLEDSIYNEDSDAIKTIPE